MIHERNQLTVKVTLADTITVSTIRAWINRCHTHHRVSRHTRPSGISTAVSYKRATYTTTTLSARLTSQATIRVRPSIFEAEKGVTSWKIVERTGRTCRLSSAPFIALLNLWSRAGLLYRVPLREGTPLPETCITSAQQHSTQHQCQYNIERV